LEHVVGYCIKGKSESWKTLKSVYDLNSPYIARKKSDLEKQIQEFYAENPKSNAPTKYEIIIRELKEVRRGGRTR
jgi:hypothetical protein